MESWSFRHIERGDPRYEQARVSACWNGKVPERFPALIAYPERDEHCQEIVQYATQHNLAIATKSGGHSWTASFLRDGGILIDLVKMNHVKIDSAARTAEVQPAAHGSDLNDALRPLGLMFPGGHCPTVGLGGFLLQGGFGWNSRNWGLACENIVAIDVVNANGHLLHANSAQNSEFYWAARGTGPAYFGVITRFYLKLYSLPRGVATSRYVFEVGDFDVVLDAVDRESAQFPVTLEVSAFIGHDQDGFLGRPTLVVLAEAFADTEDEARRVLDTLHAVIPVGNALAASSPRATTFPELIARFDKTLSIKGMRIDCDNIWTDAPVADMLPTLYEVIQNLGPAPCHLHIIWWLPSRPRQDMAFSTEGRLWIVMYAVDTDAGNDQQRSDYVVGSMRLFKKHCKGTQLADENLPAAPKRFMETSNYLRLERLRMKHDPTGRFHSYIRVPEEFEDARTADLARLGSLKPSTPF